MALSLGHEWIYRCWPMTCICPSSTSGCELSWRERYDYCVSRDHPTVLFASIKGFLSLQRLWSQLKCLERSAWAVACRSKSQRMRCFNDVSSAEKLDEQLTALTGNPASRTPWVETRQNGRCRFGIAPSFRGLQGRIRAPCWQDVGDFCRKDINLRGAGNKRLWLSGCPVACLAVWLSGCLPVWLSGCLVVCLHGCLVAWLPCCLAAWLPGCLAAWLSGCLAVWLSVYPAACLAGWLAGCLAGWLSVCLSVCACVSCLSLCLSFFLSLHLSPCLSLCVCVCVQVLQW